MNLEEPCDIGRRLGSRLDHGDGLAALIGGEFRSPPPGPAFGARRGQPTARALADHGPFQVGEPAKHLHQHAARRDGGVDVLGKGPEAGACRLDALQQQQQVFQRPRKPVQLN